MKKVVGVLLCYVLLLSSLVGCGNSDLTGVEVEGGKSIKEISSTSSGSNSNESNAQDDENYLYSINATTICSRELQEFFNLHLGCYISLYLGNSKVEPVDISSMLKNTGVVGYLTLNQGMRIVSDYNDDLFVLGLKYSNLQDKVYHKQSVNYGCNIQLVDSNLNGDFKYYKGTDAQIGVIAKVNYYIDNEQVSFGNNYVVAILENNRQNPEEWLLRMAVLIDDDSYRKVAGEAFDGTLENEDENSSYN